MSDCDGATGERLSQCKMSECDSAQGVTMTVQCE